VTTLEQGEARRRFAESRVARLGTVDDGQRPHLVPLVFALEGETVYSPTDEKPKKSTRLQRARNLEQNPNATLLADHYEEDWNTVWWVRARGRGRMVERGTEEFDRANHLLSEKYPQYEREPSTGPVIAIEVEEWLGWAYAEG
jgi:PPOX class probable F420-dependent enzyme